MHCTRGRAAARVAALQMAGNKLPIRRAMQLNSAVAAAQKIKGPLCVPGRGCAGRLEMEKKGRTNPAHCAKFVRTQAHEFCTLCKFRAAGEEQE